METRAVNETFQAITRALKIEISPNELSQAIARAFRSVTTDFEQSWPQLLKHAGDELLLSVYSEHKTVDEVINLTSDRSIWITYLSGKSGYKGFYVVRGRRRHGKKIKIQKIPVSKTDTIEEIEMPLEVFSQQLGLEYDNSHIHWVTAELAAPLNEYRIKSESAEHEHEEITIWDRMQMLLNSDREDIVVIVVYSLFIGILSLSVPLAVQLLVNTFAFGNALQPLVVLAFFVFGALGFSGALSALRKFTLEILQQRIFVRVTTDTIFRLLHAKAQAFDKIHGPELVNRYFDVVTVQKGVASILLEGLNMVMLTTIGLLLLALYHPYFLAFDIILAVCFWIIIVTMGRGAFKTGSSESASKYAVAAWLQQIAGRLVTFKGSRAADFALEHGESLTRSYIENRNQHFQIYFRQVIGAVTIYVVSITFLLVIGGWLVMESELSIGQLVAAELMLTSLVTAFLKFTKELEYYYDLIVGMEKIGMITDLPMERMGGESLTASNKPAHIDIKSVSCHFPSYPDIFSNINLSIAAGSRVGLTGVIGGGKTVLADIIYGIRIPDEGSVQIDGIDYRSLNLKDLRSQVTLVRGNEILNLSVAENIRLGSPTMKVSTVYEILRAVGLLEDMQRLPEGLNTVLKEGGSPIRLSQAMRLMIARAIAHQPRFLIIDELLDILDGDVENDILFKTLFRADAPWTLLVISKSPKVLSLCQEVYCLEHCSLNKAANIVPNSSLTEAI